MSRRAAAMGRAGAALAVGLALLLGEVPPARAQAAQATTDVGPHYVGEPVAIRVTAVGFEEEPTPESEVPDPPEGRLTLVGVSPSVSQSITIVNGRMSRTREVTHVFQWSFVAERAGPVRLGPFEIRQDGRVARVPAVRLTIEEMPSNDDVRVEVRIPEGDVFVGERVPITVSFAIEGSLQKNLLGYTLRVPLFDEQARFRFLDPEDRAGDTNVRIETAEGEIELRGETRDVVDGGRRFTQVSVTRTLVPLAPGRHPVPPASLSVEEGVRFRRDFFGGRRATQVRRWRAEDAPRTLVVQPVPVRGRPASFGGAIGRGFHLEVSADRTVIQVGDPVTLTFVLRGEGLETASLPPLDAPGLLPPERFRVPSGTPTGEIVGDTKRFTAVVRVLDEDVTEIPALAYSWFDPDSGRYETTTSRPIALSARPAEVIGAGDVQAARPAGEEVRDPAPAAREKGAARRLALTGADLAIERDADAVLGARGPLAAPWLVPGLYAGSLGLVVAAWLDRRRRRVDPARVRRRRLVDEQLAAVRGAASLPAGEAAGRLAHAIRSVLREIPEAAHPEIDTVLGECDARSYAPRAAREPLDEATRQRVLAWLRALREELR